MTIVIILLAVRDASDEFVFVIVIAVVVPPVVFSV